MRHSPHRRAFIPLRLGWTPRHEAVSCGNAASITAVFFSDRCLATPTRGEAEPRRVAAQCGRACCGTCSFRCRMCHPYVKTPLRVRVQILRRPFDDCAIGCGGGLDAPGVLSGCDCNPSCVIRGILVPLVTRASRFRGINDCAPPGVVFDTTPAVATHLFHDVLHALLTAALPDPRRMSGIANTT
jgi:hypothetical protein